VRDNEAIDAELRLLVAVRRCIHATADAPPPRTSTSAQLSRPKQTNED